MPGTEIRASEEELEAQHSLDYTALLQMIREADPEENTLQLLRERFSFRYDDVLSRVYATISVSALKAARYDPEEREPAAMVSDIPEDTLPARMTGAERGTLIHRVMERIDPEKPAANQLDRWLSEGLLSPEERAAVSARKIDGFLQSPLGKRFISAYRQKKAFRERRFIIGIPVSEVYPELKDRPEGRESLMLQGVVDLYFEEDGALVLVDYKTDSVKDPAVLQERYRVQLELYERALMQSTGKPVKERWIYSFALQKEIPV